MSGDRKPPRDPSGAAPSRSLAHPLDPSLEQLLPALMRPIIFALAHERPEMSVLRPGSLGLRADFSPRPKPKEPLTARPAPENAKSHPEMAKFGPQSAKAEPPHSGKADPRISSLARNAKSERFAWARARKRSAATPPLLLELGIARPESFRIDRDGRVPAERDTQPAAAERDPAARPGRYLRPRMPLARAPLTHLDGTAFRLDRRTCQLANESILEARPQPQFPSWYLEAYDRDFYRRWTPYIDIWGLGPLQNEWFSYWWVEFRELRLGAFPPFEWHEDWNVKWQVALGCKEQMMIRRDVKKLQKGPEAGDWVYEVFGVHIFQHERVLKLGELIEKPSWIVIAKIVSDSHEPLLPWRQAYSDWRFLLGGLEER